MEFIEEEYDDQGWTQAELNQLGYDVIGAAIEVHKHLGPGLLESVYEECLVRELQLRGCSVDRQVIVPVYYKGEKVKDALRLDLMVEDVLIIEIKAVATLLPVHTAQLISYLQLSAIPKGVLINFTTDNISRSAVHKVSSFFQLHSKE